MNRQAKTPKVKIVRKKKSKPKKTEVAKSPAKEKESVAQKKSFEVEFYRDWCKGCSICASFCPTEALAMNDKGEPEVVRPELCIGCAWCEIRCPDFAVRVKEKDEEKVREA